VTGAPALPEIVLVPHTHWDREWYQPFDAFLARLVEMMDGLIDTLDREPGFAHFHLDGQVAMVDDYLAVRPEREADLRRLAAAGRLSLGPWYTQMDEFLVSGESLLRNLETGLARARELGGGLEVGYLPDQFGHVGQMPQILRSAGIERAVVWRGVPSAVGRTTFRWEAPDGSRVVTEYLAFGYGLGWYLNHARDAPDLAEQLRNAVGLLRPLSARRRLLVTVGGDHQIAQSGLPPLLEEVRRTTEVRARIGGLDEYLADGLLPGPSPVGGDGAQAGGDGPPAGLGEDALPVSPGEDALPVWAGELRSAARAHLLPNVYSARAHQKRERARVEALVERYAEPLAALVPGVTWSSVEADLGRAWRLLLWNGAHDSVCGCSADAVAADVDARYAEARRLAEGVARRALASLAAQVRDAGTLRFNPSPFEREEVPGLGWRVEGPGWAAPAGVPVELRAEGDRAAVGVRDDGGRAAVRVRDDGGRAAVEGVALRFVDEADVGDLYNFCPDPDRPPAALAVSAGDGGLIEAAGDGVRVRATLTRPPGERFVVVEGVVENERPDHRLRLHVALPSPASGSVAVSPFELVARPVASEGSELEAASPTWPARGAVLAGGLAVLAEGVVEYEVVEGRELAVTLIRCVGTISRQELATRPNGAGPDIATPDAQMLGATAFRVAFLVPAAAADLLPEWERFALPLLEAPAPGGGTLPATGRLLEVDPRGAVLSAIRRREGALEARWWNPSRAPVTAVVAGRDVPLGPARIETLRLP
jgi:alpha-mannosidase